MATLTTDTAADQVLGLDQAGKLVKDGSVVTGNVQHAHGIHTVNSVGTDTTADTIRIVKLPSGTWLLPELCTVVHEALGTAYTVTIGDEVDPDRFSTALDVKAAGTTAFSGGVESLAPVKLTEDTWITATATLVTTPTADKLAKFNIAFKGIA